jgi:hypothetical protein
MKNGLLFIVMILIFSCGSKKSIISKVEDETKELANTVEPPVTLTARPLETDSTSKKPDINKNEAPYQDLEKSAVYNYEDWNNLLQKHVSDNGVVNYKGFKNDKKKLFAFFNQLDQLLPKETDTKAYTLAYWINAYNAFTIDLILRHYPIKSIKDIKNPWEQRYWKLGKKWYNLNEIEHEILRKMNEPRIHFAIVCASISCPKLQNEAFTTSGLEVQLSEATQEFLNDKTRNSISENHLDLSKIFQWFTKDFKQNGSLIDFLNQYSTIKISAKAKKSYKDYNWDLNE